MNNSNNNSNRKYDTQEKDAVGLCVVIGTSGGSEIISVDDLCFSNTSLFRLFNLLHIVHIVSSIFTKTFRKELNNMFASVTDIWTIRALSNVLPIH